ncbi:MAG TPA: hypothetical protein DGG94_04860 [Micromonosporaceae bacterium]|nr:hypothetical protein [Micromonosporaceae bacterium]HCU49131.1 hypothetical protein [Micromonosporaceae bacterium]
MTFTFEGREIEAEAGQTIAAALLQAGENSGVFCAIGVCFGCLVTVNSAEGQRGCLVAAQPGDVVTREV